MQFAISLPEAVLNQNWQQLLSKQTTFSTQLLGLTLFAYTAPAGHEESIGSLMFILKRQDVEISSIQHPKSGQQIPILNYQGQTFRLISVFNAQQAEEARAFWRDLTDNRGKACVLLEEPDRYSVWGKVRIDQLNEEPLPSGGQEPAAPLFTQACLLLLQAVYFDVEDLLGARQAGSFQKDITQVFQRGQFPQANSPEAVNSLLSIDPLASVQMPPWQENHLIVLLQELHRLGKAYFGNPSFTERVMDTLQDMQASERNQFITWLNNPPKSTSSGQKPKEFLRMVAAHSDDMRRWMETWD